MTTTKLKKATFKHIESELYSYKDTKREMITAIFRLNDFVMKKKIPEPVGV